MPKAFKLADLLMVPPFLAIVFWLMSNHWKRKYKHTEIGKYFFPALITKFVFTLLYAMVVEFYWGFGDTISYYFGAEVLRNAFANDPSFLLDYFKFTHEELYVMYNTPQWYLRHDQSGLIAQLAFVLSYLVGFCYMNIAWVFSLFSFWGFWRIFKTFCSIRPDLHRQLAVAILFTPSVVFWSNAITKDALMFGGLGLFTYALHRLLIVKKNRIGSAFMAIFSGYVIFSIKAYVLVGFLPAAMLWYFFERRAQLRSRPARLLFSGAFLALLAIAAISSLSFVATSPELQKFATGELVESIAYQQNVYGLITEAGSNFTLGDLDPTPLGVAKMFPKAIIACLFRPYLWEVRNPVMLLSAFEGLAMMILAFLAVRKVGIFKLFSRIADSPPILFCFIFSIIFGGFVGISTFNFGTLVRYKIPSTAFFVIGCVLLYYTKPKIADHVRNRRNA